MDTETIAPEVLQAWGIAVGAMMTAQDVRSPEAWSRAADAWAALAVLFHPAENDRRIYERLAVAARKEAR